ncbi:rhodanese-like domain-containing protein [Bacteroidota bacterium]
MIRIIFITIIFYSMAISSIVTAREKNDIKAVVQNVTVIEADSLIQAHANDTTFIILDVRTPGEFSTGHLYDAINVDYYSPNFSTTISGYDTSNTYLVYCAAGVRSAFAADTMINFGFQDVYNMLGGISQWIAAGLPVDSMNTDIISFNLFSNKVNVFPNPSEGLVFYKIEEMDNNKYLIELYDSTGKLLIHKRYSSLKQSDNKFDLTSFSNGIYFIKIKGIDYSLIKRVIIF